MTVLQAFFWYRDGRLPAPGGMNDQSHQFIALMSIVRGYWTRLENAAKA